MFVLRKISGDGVEMNFSLGESYTIISKNRNPQEFEHCFQKEFDNPKIGEIDEDDQAATRVFAFVSNHNGSFIHPLNRNQENFIMNDRGDTFCNLKNY